MNSSGRDRMIRRSALIRRTQVAAIGLAAIAATSHPAGTTCLFFETPWNQRIRNIPLPGSKVTAAVSKAAPIAPDEANPSTVPLVQRDPRPISQAS